MSAVPPKAESLKKMGDDAFMKKDFPKAIKCYVAAVSAYPQFDKAWNNMGLAYREAGNLKFAAKCFKRAYQLNDGNEFARANQEACEREMEDALFGVKREKRTITTAADASAVAPAAPPAKTPAPKPLTTEPVVESTPSFLQSEETVDEKVSTVDTEAIPAPEPEPVPAPEPAPRPRTVAPPRTEPEASIDRTRTSRSLKEMKRLVTEERVGPLGLRSISGGGTAREEPEEEYECPDCGATIEPDSSRCASCGTEFDGGSLDPDIMDKYKECESIGELLENKGRALHMFSGIQDEGLFKIYRVDKYLREAEWEISSGRFDRALGIFKKSEDLIGKLFSRYLNTKAADIYTGVRSEVLALDNYEEHLSFLAKPLFNAERALERDKPEEVIVNTVIIRDYLERLSER